MTDAESRLKMLEEEIERRLVERFAALRDEFDRLRLESDRRWAGFLDRFEQKFTGIVPAELMAEPAPPTPPSAAPQTPLSADAARSLDAAANQVEALHRFLDLCGRFSSRAALLVLRGDTAGVWKAVGFSERGADDDVVRKASLPHGTGSAMAAVLEGQPMRLEADNEISQALSASDASRAVLIPMVVKEKISGALYADCTASDQDRFDPEALAFLTFLTGLIVDRLAARKLKPAPALREFSTAPAWTGQPAAHAPEPEFDLADHETPRESEREPADSYGTQMMRLPTPLPEPEPAVPPSSVFSQPETSRPTDSSIEAPPREFTLAEEPEEPPPARPQPSISGATMRIPTSMTSPLAQAPPPPPVSPAPAPPPAAPAPPRASTGVRRLAGPLAPLEGDERREEARRFAKLLVSEIKLYNEKAVIQGRQHGNIYELLKEDIDRSRQMYDERIPEDVRANSNFFYDELVRILADGRSEALGL